MLVHRLIHQILGSDVDTVIMDGKIHMEDGQVLTANMYEALAFGEAEARALVTRAGLQNHMHDPAWGQLQRTFREPINPPSLPEDR